MFLKISLLKLEEELSSKYVVDLKFSQGKAGLI